MTRSYYQCDYCGRVGPDVVQMYDPSSGDSDWMCERCREVPADMIDLNETQDAEMTRQLGNDWGEVSDEA